MNTNFMTHALEIAQKSGKDIPIGAVIVKDNRVVAEFHNEKEKRNDATAHAEILSIVEASKILRQWRLSGCDMYVTLEPCPMCAWAIIQARLDNLYFGAYDNVYGAFSVFPELKAIANSKLNVKGGIMEKECKNILDKYFEDMR